MGKRKKTPECPCEICELFRKDGVQMYVELEAAEMRSPSRYSARFLRELKAHLMPPGVCGVCGQDYGWIHCVPFVPQIIKDFLRITHLCYGCRSRIRDLQREHEWPICWGSTSDDEIKWFLLWLQLETFNKAVRALSPAQVEKDRAFQDWLASLPKIEEEVVEDLDIPIKRRFTIRPRVSAP